MKEGVACHMGSACDERRAPRGILRIPQAGLLVEGMGPVGVEGESTEHRPFGLERERERGSIPPPECLIPPWREARVGGDIIGRAELAGSNGDARWPSPGRGVAPANVDAIEISILEACVRNLPDPPRRALFSITDPGHPHTAILDEDSANGLHQFDLLSGAN